ncbi:YnfA family protein [Skeletonema marinoi]|uniref:YnfA family protein n=1 Tax=Skeletonema marinoi TaxID=267567 RepID=A0AAD8YB66_9STRA|nr:YnfA family protein [Skeletonema marinoi]
MSSIKEEGEFQWTPLAIVQSIAIFCLAGIAEIFGGYLVWAAVKGLRVEKTESEANVNNNTSANEAVDGTSSSGYDIVKKPWWFALIGSVVLVAYGFIPCLQPSAATDGFARIYAAYGGFFIVMSFLIGWALEGPSAKPDVGDLVGGLISVVGALVIVFWPRR